MNGEGCGLSVPSPAQAWYLGKAKDKRLFNENCPWCSAKGQAYSLHSYAINFEESITLCTNSQCLYPLVSRPLECIRETLSSSQGVNKLKRNGVNVLSQFPKRQKEQSDQLEDTCTVDDLAVSFVNEQDVENHDKNECTTVYSGTQGLPFNAQNPVSSTQEEHSNMHQVNISDLELIEMVPSQPHLFWRNADNLCWLNSLLVALTHFRAFKEASDENVSLPDGSKSSSIRNLCVKFNKTCAYLKTQEQLYKENIVRVPSSVLQKTEQEIEALRHSVLQHLQPKLYYKLGQHGTPVFALPLLVESDNWAHSLLKHTGQWEFECTNCGYTLNTCVEKTLTTFTEVVADWHPLKAVHRTQCNGCLSKNQRRKLILQRLSSVFAIHFVDGLPRRDVSRYSFNFEGTNYDITTIIQYNKQQKHFTTWIHQSDGRWLEFDDLKYPHCKIHKRFTLPANQFHIVFWEPEVKHSPAEHLTAENTSFPCIKEVTSLKDMNHLPPDDECIVNALTVNDASTLDSSIGSTTLLDTFEGLSHNDIVTLTLVRVEPDLNEKPLPAFQESSVTKNVYPEKSYQTSNSNSKTSCVQNISPTLDIAPQVAPTAPPQVAQCQPTSHSLNLKASTLSFLYKQHPVSQSTPLNTSKLNPDLRSDRNEALPLKPAELFSGYRAKNSASLSEKPLIHPGVNTVSIQNSALLKSAHNPNLASSKILSTTDLLRLKLMKKLKAKKKKLAKLNQLLYKEGSESTPKPDSTFICSPYSVSSSTTACSSPAYDSFFSDLLSPSSSVSNLSPDSTGFLEKLTNSQAVLQSEHLSQENPTPVQSDLSSYVIPAVSLNNHPTSNDFFEEFIAGAELHQSVNENTDLNALDIFF